MTKTGDKKQPSAKTVLVAVGGNYRGVYRSTKGADETYYYRVTVEKDGKKVKRWVKVGAKSEGVNATYAHKKMIEAKNQINNGELPDKLKRKMKRKIVTFGALADLYFAEAKAKNRSWKTELKRYADHIAPVFAEREASTITIEEIKSFHIEKSGNCADKTANHYLNLVGTIFNNGLRAGQFKGENPAKWVRRHKINNARLRWLRPKECDQLKLETIKAPTLHTFTLLALSTGARAGALLKIKKEDVDLELRTVALKDEKADSTYTGFLSDEAIEWLRPRMADMAAGTYLVGERSTPLHYISVAQRIRPIFQRLFNEGLAPDDRLNRVVIHTLRHTFGSLLATNGTPPLTIKKLMNHSNLQMTERYSKLAPDTGREEVRKLWAKSGQ
ncbi:MAG: tyrosine-type recombinase/integrase [Campylobacterales bacterium]